MNIPLWGPAVAIGLWYVGWHAAALSVDALQQRLAAVRSLLTAWMLLG